MVGPFVFVDHLAPIALRPPLAFDVRPHPHIGISTVSYVLAGVLHHRDSLGSSQEIRPGAVNWMTAGRGIVHSERTPAGLRGATSELHALQLWVALPREAEETAPEFRHYPEDVLPASAERGVSLRLLAGEAFGARAPVALHSPLFLVDVALAPGARLPVPGGHEERAAYVLEGALAGTRGRVPQGHLAAFPAGRDPGLAADGPARVLLLGGTPFPEPRHVHWNFVSTSPERIEEARRAWAERRFPLIPGDELERLELPE